MDRNQTMKFKLITSIFLASGLLSLASCTQLAKPTQSPEAQEPLNVTAPAKPYAGYPSLLAFAHAFPDLPLKTQKSELASIEKDASTDNDAKLLLAVIYAHPASRVRDTSKAQLLLDEVLSDKTLDEGNLALATMIRGYLSEISKSGLTVREEQKRAEAIQKKLDELQKKLDDLKRIERNIVDREQGVTK